MDLVCGAPTEQIVGEPLALAALATILTYSSTMKRFQDVEDGRSEFDVKLCITLVGVALRANRGWPFALTWL
ncbi:MAG: hypothetical protein DI605_03655 [Sphingomonas sp.]|nr:MAG: hypothetical protein DI605_03655 [Sphingomonas sp.]